MRPAHGGLPEALPPGERLLWQGAPCAWALARRAFKVTTAAFYFGALLAWGLASDLARGASVGEAVRSNSLPLLLSLGALAILMLLAWLTARTTTYTITSRRVVIHFGVALPMTLNVPFAVVEAAGLRAHADATGEIPLSVAAQTRLAWPALWPHVRPWRLSRPEPMLRAVPDAAAVAQILGRALAAAASQPAPAAAEMSPHAAAPAQHGAVAA